MNTPKFLAYSIDSKFRNAYPSSIPYSFGCPPSTNWESSRSYDTCVQRCIIPNQINNVWSGINNDLQCQFVYDGSPLILLSAAPFLPQGNYGPADIATALSNFFAAGVAAYGMTGAITVTYNTVQQAFVITSTVTVPASFTITFSTPDLSSAKGNPPLSVTQRFALMIGLQDYISTLGGTSIMNFSVPGSYTLESAQLGGSKYVELRTNSCVNQLAMDPTGQQVLLIMPLGPLGTVSTYERNDGDIPKRTIRGEQLNNMQISLFDEWGIPFYLAKNANIHVELRFWPCS